MQGTLLFVRGRGLGADVPEAAVHARTEVFLALCLRLVVAITNFERGDDLGREKLRLWDGFYDKARTG